MKHKSTLKHLLSVCLCTALALVCLLCLTVNAQAAEIVKGGTCGENLTWTLDSEGTLTISGTGAMKVYTPSSVPWDSRRSSVKNVVIEDGVTSIGDFAFYYCSSLTSVTIPDGITSIGWCAFAHCTSLTSVDIPDSVISIGDLAFSSCTSLTSVDIPDSVISIGDLAFSSCTSLTSVTIGNGVTSFGDDAFSFCTSLTSVNIGNGVTSIGDRAFFRCTSLTSVDIPDSVISIGDLAFSSCTSLTSVTIPDSVTSIGKYAFECPNLTGVYISDIAAWCNISFGDYFANPLYCAKMLYLNGEIVTDLVIPDGITAIQAYAFYNCTSLTSVTIPDSVTSIGDYAFEKCISLTGIWVSENNPYYSSDDSGVLFDKNITVLIQAPGGISGAYTIPDSVTSIGEYAFGYCKSLTSVDIPDSVTSIGEYAFHNCDSLTGVYISDIAAWCNISFGNDYANPLYNAKTLYLDGEIVTDLVIPEGVTAIKDSAFYNCDSLTSVTIPDSVTSIGYRAFCSCNSLTGVYISDIAAWCNISFGNDYANPLYNAKTLYLDGEIVTDLVIPDGVTSIGDRAFSFCTSLTSVTIPDSVASIGNCAFRSCTGLTSVTFNGNVPAFGSYVLSNVTATAYYPADNTTWTEEFMQDYGGIITWNPYTPVQFEITAQPTSKTAKDGATTKFTVAAVGDGLTYQWQYRTSSSGSWKNASATGNKTKTLSVAATVAKHGYQYRCKITDNAGNVVYTDVVDLYVLGIKTQPVNKTVKAGATAKLTVSAVGDGLTYQWQYRTSSSGSWKNASATGNKTKNLSVAATVAKHGYQYRCKVTDTAGNTVYTSVVTLNVLGIKTQPVNKTVKAGATAKFTVTAVGDGLTYQWQYRTSSSGSWKNASATGNKTKTLSVAATVAKHGYQYRCKVTDSAGNVVYTNVVNLYVLGIKTQPASKTVKAGATAKLTVSAVGDGLTYQWQYRTSSSGSWKNASATGNKTKTLSVAATVAKHGYQYRCKVTDSAGNVVYTKVVNLYVLGIKNQPVSKTVKAGATAKFTVTAVGNGLTYQWQYRTSSSGSWKNASATGNKTKTLSVAATVAKHGY